MFWNRDNQPPRTQWWNGFAYQSYLPRTQWWNGFAYQSYLPRTQWWDGFAYQSYQLRFIFSCQSWWRRATARRRRASRSTACRTLWLTVLGRTLRVTSCLRNWYQERNISFLPASRLRSITSCLCYCLLRHPSNQPRLSWWTSRYYELIGHHGWRVPCSSLQGPIC